MSNLANEISLAVMTYAMNPTGSCVDFAAQVPIITTPQPTSLLTLDTMVGRKLARGKAIFWVFIAFIMYILSIVLTFCHFRLDQPRCNHITNAPHQLDGGSDVAVQQRTNIADKDAQKKACSSKRDRDPVWPSIC